MKEQLLPEELWQSLVVYLHAKDVLSLFSVNKSCAALGRSSVLWNRLLAREDVDDDVRTLTDEGGYKLIRAVVMNYAHKDVLSSVKWYPVRARISNREGHLGCVLTNASRQRRIVITGGFSDDDTIYMCDPGSPWEISRSSRLWQMVAIGPSRSAGFIYGASLTPMACEESGLFRAVRFGGFRSGGYCNETNQVAVLTIRHTEGEAPTATWQEMETKNSHLAVPRAYHTATLIGGRYLLIVGGMMARGSIVCGCILDMQTWTWVDETIIYDFPVPSGRHGHSIVLDTKRNRLVLFGGGNGTDLLRSGTDNSEVWELKFGSNWKSNLVESLPWKWNHIIGRDSGAGQSDDNSQGSENAIDTDAKASENLTSVERLCLGRCHSSCKISPNKVVLFFGSGRPSTNGLISFDLNSNSFHRPKVKGVVPAPRFTGVAVSLVEGLILTHGGYSTQLSDAIDDFDVLDVAPELGRDFNKLPIDTTRDGYQEVTDNHAQEGRAYASPRDLMALMIHNILRGEQVHRVPGAGMEDSDDDSRTIHSNSDYQEM